MNTLHIANAKGRDARVRLLPVRKRLKRRYINVGGAPVKSVQILKSTCGTNYKTLEKKYGSQEEIAKALINGDPEIDIENAGKILDRTTKVYIRDGQELAYSFKEYEVIRKPDGTEEKRPLVVLDSNINIDEPLRWSGVMFQLDQAYKRFVFVRTYQISHIDGLTYEFLYSMAKELEEKNAMVLIGAGKKGTNPVVMTRGNPQYRAFLEGRTQGDRYCLLLHLTNMELKGVTTDDFEKVLSIGVRILEDAEVI